jgi:hypothetical protein
MSKRLSVSEYLYYPVDANWRFSVRDETDDIVLRVDFFNTLEKPGEWKDIARIEQSGHTEFHAHLPGSNYRFPIAQGLKREEKLEIGFDKLRGYAIAGAIYYKTYVFNSSPEWDDIKTQMLNKEIPMGTIRNGKSISAVAKIADSLEVKKFDSKGHLRSIRSIDGSGIETVIDE